MLRLCPVEGRSSYGERMTKTAPGVVARGLTKSCGPVPAVDGVDVTVERGAMVAGLGPNGLSPRRHMCEKLINETKLCVPAHGGVAGDGAPVAWQLDAALLDVGFAALRALLDQVGAWPPSQRWISSPPCSPQCVSWSRPLSRQLTAPADVAENSASSRAGSFLECPMRMSYDSEANAAYLAIEHDILDGRQPRTSSLSSPAEATWSSTSTLMDYSVWRSSARSRCSATLC